MIKPKTLQYSLSPSTKPSHSIRLLLHDSHFYLIVTRVTYVSASHFIHFFFHCLLYKLNLSVLIWHSLSLLFLVLIETFLGLFVYFVIVSRVNDWFLFMYLRFFLELLVSLFFINFSFIYLVFCFILLQITGN